MTFKKGDKVLVAENYEDEQLGEFAPYGVQTVVDVKEGPTTLGQMIKIRGDDQWVDARWFVLYAEKINYKKLLDEFENISRPKMESHFALVDFCQWLQEKEDKRYES